MVAAVDVPVNVLFRPGRHTVPRLADLGVRRISLGSLLFRTALHAAVTTALTVARDGSGPTGVPGHRDVDAPAGMGLPDPVRAAPGRRPPASVDAVNRGSDVESMP